MLATLYDYEFTLRPGGVLGIALRQKATGKTVMFRLAGIRTEAAVRSIHAHMRSLTDDCCAGYFERKRKS